PDLARGHLALLAVVETGFDLVHDGVEPRGRDGPLLAGLDEPGPEFLAVEGLPTPVLLDDDVGDLLDRLVGGEPPAAGGAFAPPPDDLAFRPLRGAHPAIVQAAAKRAFHAGRDRRQDSGLGTRDSNSTPLLSIISRPGRRARGRRGAGPCAWR